MTNGFSQPYHLDESIFILGASGVISFEDIHVSKQDMPRWDAAFCGVTSGAIRFAYGHMKRTPGLCGLSKITDFITDPGFVSSYSRRRVTRRMSGWSDKLFRHHYRV